MSREEKLTGSFERSRLGKVDAAFAFFCDSPPSTRSSMDTARAGRRLVVLGVIRAVPSGT